MTLHLVDNHQPWAPQPSVLTAGLCEQLTLLNTAVRSLRAAGFRIHGQGLRADNAGRPAYVQLGALDSLQLAALRQLTDAEVLYADGRARASYLGTCVLYLTPAARCHTERPPSHPGYGCTSRWASPPPHEVNP